MLLRINLLLLLAAAFLPFPTGVLAQAFDASDEAERTAIILYGGTALVIELLLRTAVRYALSRPELLDVPPDKLPPPAPKRAWRESIPTRGLRAGDPRRDRHRRRGRLGLSGLLPK